MQKKVLIRSKQKYFQTPNRQNVLRKVKKKPNCLVRIDFQKTKPPFAHFPHSGESDPYEYSWVILYSGLSEHCKWMTEMQGKGDVRADAKGLSVLIRDWRHGKR